MSNPEQNKLPQLHEQKSRFPQSWEEVCRQENFFTDRRLAEFPEKFLQFYLEQVANPDHTMQENMEAILKSARENYSPADTEKIIKMYVFSCVLTQHNEKKGKKGESQTVRKDELDSNGNPYPAFIHPSRMLLSALNEIPAADLDFHKPEKKKGINTVTAMAIAGHDLIEDCEMTVRYVDNLDKQVEGKITGKKGGGTISIDELIQGEFPDIGHRVATQINAVTKFESYPEGFEKTMNESGIKLFLDKTLLPPPGRSKKKTSEKSKGLLDNEKAVASIYKIRAVPYAIYQEKMSRLDQSSTDYQSDKERLLEEYNQDIVSGIYIKCRDTLDNGPGISRASQIRARQLATLARLIGFYEISNDLMIMLAQKEDNPFTQDQALAGLAKTLTKERRNEYNQQLHDYFEQNFGISTRVQTGLRISFSDENGDSKADEAVPQAIITIPRTNFIFLLGNLDSIINNDQFKAIVGKNSPLSFQPYEGILEKATRIWGREGIMLRILDKDKKTVFHIRLVDDKPLLSDCIMQDRSETEEKSPEESIFRRSPVPNLSVPMEEKLLHAALFYLYPEFLRDFRPQKGKFKNFYIVIWDKGFTTIKGLKTAKQLCEELGIDYQNPVITEFKENNGTVIDPKNPPKLPIIRLKESVLH